MASAPEPEHKVSPLYHYPIVVPCDLCETKDDVNSFCRNCSQNLCDGCKRLHLRSTVSRDHNVVHISEGKSSDSEATFCTEHGERLFFYCRTCSVLFCPKCLNPSHRSHDFLDTDEYAKELESRVAKIIMEKSRKLEVNRKNAQHIEKSKNKFTDTCALCKKSIIDTANILHSEVDRVKVELLSTISNHETQGLSKFHEAEHQVNSYWKEMNESMEKLAHHSKKHDNISLVAYASKLSISECQVTNDNDVIMLSSMPDLEHRTLINSKNEISRLFGTIHYQDSDILRKIVAESNDYDIQSKIVTESYQTPYKCKKESKKSRKAQIYFCGNCDRRTTRAYCWHCNLELS